MSLYLIFKKVYKVIYIQIPYIFIYHKICPFVFLFSDNEGEGYIL